VSEARQSFGDRRDTTVRPDDFGHPRGTLVIVILFALLFGLAWLAVYVWVFLERGAPHA
jgi:hypothetical protein